MSINVRPISNLTAKQRAEWVRIVAETPDLANPFLHPAFAETADRTLHPVEVAMADGGVFLPFHRDGLVAGPVAEGLNEQQAVIGVRSNDVWPQRDWLGEVGIRTLRFDHLLGEQASSLGVWTSRIGGSPQADLSAGFDAYAAARKQAGSSTIRETLRKERKLVRECGEVEYSWHDDAEDVFERLIEWKQVQHQRTGVVDLFDDPTIVDFLRQIRLVDEPAFRARMSVLRAAGRPVAVHLGLFSNRVGHVWYPAYDTDFAAYSPGLILLLKIMRSMSDNGLETLDFGPGPQRYKRSLMTRERPICIGVADQSVVASTVRRSIHALKQSLKRPRRAAELVLGAVRLPQWLTNPTAKQAEPNA